MQKRNVLNSPRLLELKKHRRKDFQNKIYISFFAIFVIFALLVYLSRLPSLNISGIEVSGNKVIDTKDVQSVVEKETSGKYLWLFPKSNVFLYPENAIKRELGMEFSRFGDVEISTNNNAHLVVTVLERSPEYTWCGNTLPEVGAKTNECYFIDDSGYIFDTAPYFSGEIYFKFYGTVENMTENPEGNPFAPEIFNQLIQVKETLEGMKLKPVSLFIEDNGDIEMYLSPSGTVGASNPKIIFNKNEDFQNIVENLDSALSTDPLKTDFQKKYSSLIYIDLRYGNKVYYKFR